MVNVWRTQKAPLSLPFCLWMGSPLEIRSSKRACRIWVSCQETGGYQKTYFSVMLIMITSVVVSVNNASYCYPITVVFRLHNTFRQRLWTYQVHSGPAAGTWWSRAFGLHHVVLLSRPWTTASTVILIGRKMIQRIRECMAFQTKRSCDPKLESQGTLTTKPYSEGTPWAGTDGPEASILAHFPRLCQAEFSLTCAGRPCFVLL